LAICDLLAADVALVVGGSSCCVVPTPKATGEGINEGMSPKTELVMEIAAVSAEVLETQ
jgi:hypothetical protein